MISILSRSIWGGDIKVIATTSYTAWLEPRQDKYF
jgi:hypothetical protein